ncbi:MAG: MBL fold metallo-hydrolase [Alphaproteobacteria bacterium]|nr:MBL fold metallo-hydrolase [Alphaproteobacteria bacterium]MDP6517144.1 MBL fold metallo-hydrolase [Alphaproteobacteria bacterium]
MRGLTRRAGLALVLIAVAPAAGAGDSDPDYGLAPAKVADGIYVLWGRQEALTQANGANIANAAFVVGSDSVLAVDAGPTRRYGEQMLAAIGAVTDRPVATLVITHHHLDHSFGMAAFAAAGAEIVIHAEALPALDRDSEILLANMNELIGPDWLAGTAIGAPTRLVRAPETVDLGGRAVRILAFAGGHSPGDLAVIDEATATLIAGDLVFMGRAAAVLHADIPTWLDQIDHLAAMGWRRLIPGHGPLVGAPAELDPLRDYLGFVEDFTRRSHGRGDSPLEALMVPLPPRFAALAQIEAEYQRAIFSQFNKFDRLDTATPPPPE